MDRQTLIEELKSMIQDFLKTKNLYLVDLIYRYEGKDLVLRILVDKPEGGISLDECAYLNNNIGEILDEKDIIQGRYILEVFSPGLDWPLKSKDDFLRCINRSVRFFLNELINGKLELEGTINKVGDDSVYIDIDGNTIEIPISKITKAKQIVDNI